jgi:hypothetical protein
MFQPWILTDRLMVFAIRDGVLRFIDISACTSLQVLLIATTGRAVLELRWDIAFLVVTAMRGFGMLANVALLSMR